MRTNESQKTWTDRFNEALALRGKSPADISKATGITPAGIKKWIDGDVSKPKFDDVFAVCSFLDITTEWLMKGIGSINDKTMPAANMVSIQQVDFYGSCGVGVMNFEDYPEIKTLQVTPAWFSRNFSFYNPRDVKIITALGDSMEPTFRNGDLIVVDRQDRDLKRDGVFCVLVDGDLYVKRVQRIPGAILFISDNSLYRPFEIPIKEVEFRLQVLGRVVNSMNLKRYD